MRRGNLVLAVLTLAIASGARAGMPDGSDGMWLPLEPPQRPFLLVDAPRRFVPGERAEIRVQLRGGGELELALFRVRDPASAIGLAGRRQGVSIAREPLGAEAEALLAGDTARGQRLELVGTRRIDMPKPRDARYVADESEVYDSNESAEEEVATYWVQTGGFSVRDVPLGRLPTGLYLARVHAGPWATTAMVSVGQLVLLARRGDTHDVVHVTDADGRPLRDVPVRVEADGNVMRSGSTGTDGTLRMPATEQTAVRFVAERDGDIAWSDVIHAGLEPCDPRVYLATGRPVYRNTETVYVRGHVRGCDEDGNFVALADEPVELSPVPAGAEEVHTDDDGNFAAQMLASHGTLTATVRGEEQQRTIQIDHRQLPVRGLQVSVDRPFAATGETVRVEVADDEGGWPRERDLVLDTPAGRFMGRIGPGQPAIFHVTVPPTTEPAERFAVHATLTDGSRVTSASAELWVGRSPMLLELGSPKERGRRGERFPLSLRATDLVGRGVDGLGVQLAVHGSDGNAPRGAARWEGHARLDAAGTGTFAVPLEGEGPWMVLAKRGDARARLVVWERERPPQLSGRGPLAVAPRATKIDPGQVLEVDVRLPAGRGRAWLTMEQGSVWHAETLPREPGSTVRARLRVPERTRGLAKVVVAHVANGEVETATATVEVRTAREATLALSTDRHSYAQGETAKVSLAAHTTDGQPSDGVISLWLADAGYWEMGDEDYPLPGEYLQLPGRMATGADSTQPIAYGAEEGRVIPDARMEWNGALIDGTTYRHAWGHYGRLVRIDRRGDLAQVVRELARGAGLAGSFVCEEKVADTGTVTLLARDLPWDMVALKLSDQIGLSVSVHERVLRYECPGTGLGGGGMGGLGHGAGAAGLRTGNAHIGQTREERLEGTLHFVGLRRLGPDGKLELEVPLPDHPGRWRIESLLVRDDGGGARAHAVAHTRRSLEVWTDLPTSLLPGDQAPGAIHVRAPSLAGQPVDLSVVVPMALELSEEPPGHLVLDARGEGTVPLRLTARDEGTAELVVGARAGAHEDAIRKRVLVLPDAAEQPVAMRALVGPEATDVHVPLPELTEAATLEVQVDSGLRQSIGDALEGLREPRWHLPAMRIDRLHSINALLDAASRIEDTGQRRLLESELEHAHESEAAALARLVTSAGGVGWWTSLPDDGRLTAEALIALGPRAGETDWREAWDSLRRRVADHTPGGENAAIIAAALGSSPTETDREHARELLDAASSGDPTDVPRLTWALRAAVTLEDEARVDALSAGLEAALRARVADGGQPGPCRGPIWFLCYERWGERAELTRAAATLLDARSDARPVAIDTLRYAIRQGPTEHFWVWGSAEADVLALASRLYPRAGAARTPLRVTIDGQNAPVRAGRIEIPAGAHDVRVSFAAHGERLLRLRVDGAVRAAPPTARRGNVELARRFERHDGAWTAAIDLRPTARTRGVDLVVPLPAGLDLAGGAEPPEGARLAVVDGAVHLHFAELRPGRRTIHLPLVALTEGTFGTAPATLRDARGEHWAVTPSTTTTVD